MSEHEANMHLQQQADAAHIGLFFHEKLSRRQASVPGNGRSSSPAAAGSGFPWGLCLVFVLSVVSTAVLLAYPLYPDISTVFLNNE